LINRRSGRIRRRGAVRTNLTIRTENPLHAKAEVLIKAASDYWKEYQKQSGTAAVVWLDTDCGHFVLFTRGEYRQQIMGVVDSLRGEAGLVKPFEAPESPRITTESAGLD